AEGIETLEQARRMRAMGCTYGQGYYFAHPLAEAQIEGGGQWLETAVHEERAERAPRRIGTNPAASADPAAA
ncbi:MAG: EAL domain-containing protein, partial [Chloroflexota bacterium]|nr:EAL domain-containing protein [Chloroflexota bacterium]